MRFSRLLAVCLIAAVPACGTTQHEEASAGAAPIRVLSSNGVKAAVDDVMAELEKTVGRPLSIEFSTAASLKETIEKGEPFDVAILTPALLHELASTGHVVGDSRVRVARSGVGVGVREGAPRPDVSTPDALKQTLLNAKSVAFTAEGQSRRTIEATFDRLGIADQMRPKVMLLGPAGGPLAVAKGEAELTMTLTSESLPIPGVQLVGPLPGDLQDYVTFEAARSAHAKDPEAADALLRALVGPVFTSALEPHGMESVE